MSLILLPTVEFEPFSWAESGYDAVLATAEWEEFWSRSLLRWQVKPIEPGSWNIATESIQSEDTLTKLLLLRLEGRGVVGFPDQDGEVDVDEERIGAISGGYALTYPGGRTVAQPSCCCDLGDLRAWRSAATLVAGEGIILEIGHGTWSANRDAEGVLLTNEPELAGFAPVTTRVSSDELLTATHVAEVALEAFRQRLLPILLRLVGDAARADSLSCLLVGLPIA
jgi:hypothetical protein